MNGPGTYHAELAAMRETVRELWRVEEAARRRLDEDWHDQNLHVAYAEATQKRQDAQQAMDEYRGES